MFIGTGLDTDGDGDDDIYIGGRVGKGGAGDTIIFLLFGLPLLLFFAFLGLVAGFWLIKMLWDMFSESGAANTVVQAAVSAFWSVVSVVFWVAMGLLCVSAIVVMLVGIFYKEKD